MNTIKSIPVVEIEAYLIESGIFFAIEKIKDEYRILTKNKDQVSKLVFEFSNSDKATVDYNRDPSLSFEDRITNIREAQKEIMDRKLDEVKYLQSIGYCDER